MLQAQALSLEAPERSWPSRIRLIERPVAKTFDTIAERSKDERRSPRQRVLLSAVAVHEDFNITFRCTIRDISEGGALLNMPSGRLVPAKFWLIKVTAGVAQEATVAWRRYPCVGLSLGDPVELDDPMTRIARRLRRFWVAAVN